MIDTKTPAIRLRKITVPSNVASAVGNMTARIAPTHSDRNGIHKYDPFTMQQRSWCAPGSAFQNMKSGITAPLLCWLVVLASLSGIAIM